MVSCGGLGGLRPPQESPLPVPCPRALPPIYAYDLRVRFTRTIYELDRFFFPTYWEYGLGPLDVRQTSDRPRTDV